ncbi:MAG: cupin-like domain-containing protein [Candidatus Amoebophilus sp.]
MSFLSLVDNFPRIHKPSLEQWNKIGPDMPFVITGIVSEWPGFKNWTVDYLKQKYGQLVIKVRDKRKGIYTSRKDVIANPGEPMLFMDYCDKIIESKDLTTRNYYMFERNPQDLPGLNNEFMVPSYIQNKCIYPGFWVSGKGAMTHLHYDRGHNLLAQVKGRKKLIIYRPNLSYFYPYPRSGVSQVDLENPNYDKFPKFRFAQPLVCDLEEGELLYLPSCWWHQVYSVDVWNVSINFFWRPPLRYQLLHPGPSLRPYCIKFCEKVESLLKK